MNIDFAVPVFGDEEREAVNRVMEGVWLASGDENVKFEREFAKYIGKEYAVCVNSGSSANLLALASLQLPKGSKVLTSACGFPATVAPIIHLGLEPVLVDYDMETQNISIDEVNKAIELHDIKAIIFADTMGIPVDLVKIHFDGPVIQDCCEALGGTYNGKQLGYWSTLATYSFYPSHQITALGGGGMVVTDDSELYKNLISLRDWGKVYADGTGYLGRNNTSYNVDVGGVPYFAHYAYEFAGYNFKLPEANAAFGRVQLERLPKLSARRYTNWRNLELKLGSFTKVPNNSYPSFFGFTIISENRDRLGDYLESKGIRHRPFFAGNITKHKPFLEYEGSFPVADYLMKNALFIGCHPLMTKEQLSHISWVYNSFDVKIDHHPV